MSATLKRRDEIRNKVLYLKSIKPDVCPPPELASATAALDVVMEWVLELTE